MSIRSVVSALATAAVLALGACSSTPPPPHWQLNAQGSAERAVDAWLSGNNRIAEAERRLADRETRRTADPTSLARLALLRCAAQVASVQLGPCEAFAPYAADAAEAERAYARYLQGQASGADAPLLPPAQRPVVALDAAALATRLHQVADPLSRLVAAGVAWQRGQGSPALVAQAVDTASAQGWTRPLMAWLMVQRDLARQAGQVDEVARIERRLALLK
jgi:hypothetical protein